MSNKVVERLSLASIIVAIVSVILGHPLGLLMVIPAVLGCLFLMGGESDNRRVGFLFKVAVGRGYSPLTMEKRQQLCDKGYATLEERDGTYVVIESETMRGAIITAGDLGQRVGLMLLWR